MIYLGKFLEIPMNRLFPAGYNQVNSLISNLIAADETWSQVVISSFAAEEMSCLLCCLVFPLLDDFI